MAPPSPMVHVISKSTIKPSPLPSSAHNPCHLSPWDISLLSLHYIQRGLLFSSLSSCDHILITHLTTSLSAVLHHFYPLAGRLVAQQEHDGLHMHIGCNNEGAELIHAAAHELTVADILAHSGDVPRVLQSFFPLDGAVNFDGSSLPLFAAQVTELANGVFLGCALNHAVGDGTSFWYFLNAWSEISRTQASGDGAGEVISLSHPPILERWFIDGMNPPFPLPYSREDEFIERYSPPALRERMFYFVPESVARLKEKANKECKTEKISSFQALCSLVWRSVTRARQLRNVQETSCRLAIENRSRLRPPLSPSYFGNYVQTISATTTVEELRSKGLGWGAWLVHQSVAAHTDGAVRESLKERASRPVVYKLSEFDPCSVLMGGSPRSEAYGCDFGWGRPVAVRNGSTNKIDGKMTWFPGWDGGGGVELEVCLSPEAMSALESDHEFMEAVAPPRYPQG